MNKKKIILIVLGCVFAFLAAGYVGVSVYFSRVFYPHTFINGIEVSNDSPEEVKAALEQTMENYEMDVVTIEGTTEVLNGKDFDFNYNFDEVDRLKEKEMGWYWPVRLFSRTDYEVEALYEWNTEKLNEKIDALQCLTQEMTPPSNASLTIDENGLNLVEEVKGNTLKKDEVRSAIAAAMEKGDTELDLEAAGCYEAPEVTMESPEIQDELKKVDELCQAEITYNFHGNEEKIGKEQIRNWVRRDGDGKLYVSRDGAYNYLCELANKYDTVNSYRSFWSSRGYEITLDPGTYGWGTDVDTEINLLMEDINNKRKASRDPAYYMTPYNNLDPNSPDDIGFTYVEIDLSGQYMWFYKNGEVFVSTPITSGTMSTGHGTPSGVYFINCRQQNTILVGEDYRTPVNFWMQVVGGVGIHDSLWRSVYGGTEYLNAGSHGCINTPYDACSSIFWNIEVGTPVIMYY
ncbi:peptidoglycan binding domain-containing protein [Frisingicoccus sp.]|uniref:L,D-transpeptidase family protein n=1 Tax=Frisingicoccus sp. TaxID=1918627 RepID=UPI0015BAAB30